MLPINLPSQDKVIQFLKDKSDRKFGLISINFLLINSKMDDLVRFAKKFGIAIPNSFITRMELLKLITLHLIEMYYSTNIQKKYNDPLEYIGYALINEKSIKAHLNDFDFIVKQDLLDVFADFCADMGKTVYSLTNSIRPKMDIYLAQKKSSLKTESVFAIAGSEINAKSYLETKNLIEKAQSVANHSIFITTPVGALKIGLRKLIIDLSHLNCSLYVIDPSRKIIFPISKSRKNDNFDEDLREDFIHKLPRVPMRAASQLIELSNYKFNEIGSFAPEEFRLFDIYDDLEHNKMLLKEEKRPKYEEIFRDLIIMENSSGSPIISYTSENFKEQALASGFLSAMDSFISQIGGSTMEEINYKGFYVQAAYGRLTKLACFLSKPADKSLKERLKHLIELFEENFKGNILEFKKSGDTGLFDTKKTILLIKETLDI
jgi:hypothetical protein